MQAASAALDAATKAEQEEKLKAARRKSKWEENAADSAGVLALAQGTEAAAKPRASGPSGGKPQICVHFTQGLCTKGYQCDNAHSVMELAPGGSKGKMCPQFLAGTCIRGDICLLAHGTHELPQGFKTRLCSFFAHGSCPKNDFCAFAHGEVELRIHNPNASAADLTVPKAPVTGGYKTKLCMHFQKGACPRGKTCSFAHGEEELKMYGAKAKAPQVAQIQAAEAAKQIAADRGVDVQVPPPAPAPPPLPALPPVPAPPPQTAPSPAVASLPAIPGLPQLGGPMLMRPPLLQDVPTLVAACQQRTRDIAQLAVRLGGTSAPPKPLGSVSPEQLLSDLAELTGAENPAPAVAATPAPIGPVVVPPLVPSAALPLAASTFPTATLSTCPAASPAELGPTAAVAALVGAVAAAPRPLKPPLPPQPVQPKGVIVLPPKGFMMPPVGLL